MKSNKWRNAVHLAVVSLTLQECHACSDESRNESPCWYTLWYIWFVLGLFVIVLGVLIVLYIKHRVKDRSRSRRRRRSTRTVPIHIVPMGPPAYAEPSHKPPSYDEAMSRPHRSSLHVPAIQTDLTDAYQYQPPPTSMRMFSTVPPQSQPPSYASCTQNSSTQGQGHPT